MTEETTTGERITLSNLRPAPGSTRPRKRVGRGISAGGGKTAGRGQKGQKSRSGSHNMRAGFAGGQNPFMMQQGKLRGSHMKKSMPMGPFRTHTYGVNLRELEKRFDGGAEITPELLDAAGVIRNLRHPVKILGVGELTKALTVHAHGFSASARAKIEAAGGKVWVIGAPDEGEEPVPVKRKKRKAPAQAEPEAEGDAGEGDAAEPEAKEPAGEAEGDA